MPIPLSTEVICVVPCLLCRGCIVGEKSCVSRFVFTQILSEGSLCGKSCVDELVEILLCEGGDVELGVRTSKHILVFAFDPLSLTLSLICLALHHIHILYMLGIICVTHLC